MLKAEVIETLPHGFMTWIPNKPEYDSLRRVKHCTLLRCLGRRKRKHDDCTPSYADTLAETASERIEAIVRKRRILFAGFIARMAEGAFGESIGSKDWLVHLDEDTSVSGMKLGGRRKAAQKDGTWVRRIEKGLDFFMRNDMRRRDAELQSCRATREGHRSANHRRHL